MRTLQRVVVDTNVLVSRLLIAESIPGRAVREARRTGRLLVSEATLNELAEFLAREKLDRYVSREQRKQFLRQFGRIAEFVPVIHLVRECRDPKDDKFLELALNGRANVMITGDADLLGLHPWRGVAILAPAEFLKSLDI
jgi:putative PIN family toxin of toxin-antitoxin system